MWLLFQCMIMIAVGWTGIYYQWTPNNVALGIVAVGAAWLATKIICALPVLWRLFADCSPTLSARDARR
jgi:hypothetical protein